MVTLANADNLRHVGTTPAQALGKPLLASVPELRGQASTSCWPRWPARAWPFVGQEVVADLRQAGGTVATRYFNFVYQWPATPSAGR